MKKIIYFIAFIIIASCNSISNSNAPQSLPVSETKHKIMKLSSKQKKEITIALQKLLKRTNSDAFVIINEQITENYVQFVVNGGQLLFDVPTIQFNDQQIIKAKQVLSVYDVQLDDLAAPNPNEQKITRKFSVFNKNLGTDITTAIQMSEKMIVEVFNVTQKINLKIDEN